MSTKRFFDFTFIKKLQISWVQRLFQNFFGKQTAKAVEEPVLRTVVEPPKPQPEPPQPPKPAQPPQPPSPPQPPIPPQPIQQQREMHSSIVQKAAALRIPLIKFVGARLPRPHYDSASLPPLQISGNFSAPVSNSTPAKASSIGPVGKIPRGQGIEPSQLPPQFRRAGISEEEIEAINSGFFYQR